MRGSLNHTSKSRDERGVDLHTLQEDLLEEESLVDECIRMSRGKRGSQHNLCGDELIVIVQQDGRPVHGREPKGRDADLTQIPAVRGCIEKKESKHESRVGRFNSEKRCTSREDLSLELHVELLRSVREDSPPLILIGID